MFDHVTIRVRDLGASLRFYTEALGEPTHATGAFTEWGEFGIARASADEPATSGLHVGFGARDRAEVDAWWERLTAAGYASDGDPGERPLYHASYYGAFALDPDGNSVELVHHHRTDPGASIIDHLWLRTAALAAAQRFYETIAPVTGIGLVHEQPERIRFSDGVGSFTFVAGEAPTENVHLAFGVHGVSAVEEFHALATAAGYRDNGPPGERPQYHRGYHGAFVLDPDGHNVEAVFHDRSVA